MHVSGICRRRHAMPSDRPAGQGPPTTEPAKSPKGCAGLVGKSPPCSAGCDQHRLPRGVPHGPWSARTLVHAGSWKWVFGIALAGLWVMLMVLGSGRLPDFQPGYLFPVQSDTKPGVDPCASLRVDAKLGTPKPANGELVLVTGGSGFIGSHLVEQLLELGYRVRVFDNLETGNLQFLNLRHPRLQFVLGDILDIEALRRAMVDVRGVFHLGAASKVLPSLKNPAMGTFNVERNSVGTSRVLEAANETMMVRKVVYAASSTYYGNQGVPFAETDPFMPTSPYAASKYMGELVMLTNDELYKLPTLSLRFFMVYGPRNPAHGAYAIVTGKFIDRLKKGLPLVIEGDGRNFRDFVHVKDVARALILGYQGDVHGTSINIGSGEKHSVKEVANLVSANQEHVAARRNDLLGTLADTCRAKKLLNFAVQHDFLFSMQGMIKEALAGKSDYFAPMWEEPAVQDRLEKHIPGWKGLPGHERNAKLRAALVGSETFFQILDTL